MANLGQQIRAEIVRVSRQQIQRELAVVQRDNEKLKGVVETLTRRVRDLERGQGGAGIPVRGAGVDMRDANRLRPSGRMIRQLRKKLEVSQRQFGLLLGVSAQAVYLWERQPDALNLRSKARRALYEVRSMSKEEAHEQLAKLE